MFPKHMANGFPRPHGMLPQHIWNFRHCVGWIWVLKQKCVCIYIYITSVSNARACIQQSVFGWDATYSQGFGGCVGPRAYIKDSVSTVQQMEPRTEAMSLYLSVYLYIYTYLPIYLPIYLYICTCLCICSLYPEWKGGAVSRNHYMFPTHLRYTSAYYPWLSKTCENSPPDEHAKNTPNRTHF